MSATPWESPIIRVSTGRLNTVSDAVIGGSASIGSRSRYAGQIGKVVSFDGSQIGLMFDSAVGTLYPARYRYVRVRAEDDASPAMTAGRIAFWDTTVTNWWQKYQVTRDENLSSSDNAVMIAGIFIGAIDSGNYGFIAEWGLCDVRFRTVLTAAGAIGSRVYAAGAGDVGFDSGTADVLTTDSTSLANARYLGTAVTAPAAGALDTVFLELKNYLP